MTQWGLPKHERFALYVETSPDPDACFGWRGGKDRDGRGTFQIATKRTIKASRFAWSHANGHAIPKGMEICHTCDNPNCVNPRHLYLGTHLDNMRDMRERGRAQRRNAQKTHCPSGHPYEGDNLYTVPSSGGRGCRTCRRAQTVKTTERRRAIRRQRHTLTAGSAEGIAR